MQVLVTSTSNGRQPASTMALGVATNVKPGQAISEPAGIPAAMIASASAAVPLVTASACRLPK